MTKSNKPDAALLEELESLRLRHGLSYEDLKKLLREQEKKKKLEEIPVSIFNTELAPLETLAKYYRENHKMKFSEMEALLGRNQTVLSITYKRAKEKMPEKLESAKTEFSLPVKKLQNKKLSVLENVVAHMRDKYGLKYSEIAEILGKDQRTIWTVYNRAQKKTFK